MNLKKLRALSHVWRFNFHPRVRQESVAEHSYWTTVYALELLMLSGKHPLEILNCLMYAIYHDSLEAITGDLPGPVKRGRVWHEVESDVHKEMGWWPSGHLTDDDKLIVKAADLISALVFADEEVRLGNSYFKQIRGELLYAINSLKMDTACKLVEELGFSFSDQASFHPEMSHL